MSKGKNIVQVEIDGFVHLIPAKHVHVSTLERPLPPCQWCKKSGMIVLVEYIQRGFADDKHTAICGCFDCQNATVFEFVLNH